MLKKMIMFAAVVCVVLGFTSTAPADYHDWRATGWFVPAAVDGDWSNPLNWTGPAVPSAGDTLRFELSAGDPTSPITMNVDYSRGGLDWARFTGNEIVYIQNYLKVTSTGNNAFQLSNGGLGGSYVRVDSGGTIWGKVVNWTNADRLPPTLDFAGGNMAAGNLWYANEQRTIIKVSSASGSITPGAIQVSDAPWQSTNPNRWPVINFQLAATGVAPITLTDADPLQFTNTAAGTNPFKLTVDTTAYTGSEFSIPLFTHAADTDRMFASGNITITQTTPGEWWVTQADTGVTLDRIPEPASAVLLLIGAPLLALRRRRRS